jgi:hypothetical protein
LREGKDDWRGQDDSGRWEQQSVPLRVPEGYEDRFGEIKSYIQGELEVLGDEELEQEIETIERLLEGS